jgi:hypothetical protein
VKRKESRENAQIRKELNILLESLADLAKDSAGFACKLFFSPFQTGEAPFYHFSIFDSTCRT